jgi:dTDP-glucose pyrophosphorylase
MKEKTLVILAAGMGSRFGGLKQIEPIGPNGEFIIDYSIYDAIRYGFNKIVFIIKEENYEVFKETIGKRIETHVKVEYVFQTLEDVPKEIKIPKDRIKPLGTGQALYCARKHINGPFAVISADDFYGPESFELLSKSLDNEEEYSVIGYQIGNTITENGSVKRGVIFVNNNHNLSSIIESKVQKNGDILDCEPLDGTNHFTVPMDHPVSMLMFGFQKGIVKFLEGDINNFFDENKNDLSTCEYLLPDVMDKYLKEKNIAFKVINTPSIWHGMTYKEDLIEVKNSIQELINKGIYKENLWF